MAAARFSSWWILFPLLSPFQDASETDFFTSLRESCKEFLTTCREAGYYPSDRYDRWSQDLDRAANRERWIELLHRLAQFAYDHDLGDSWIVRLTETLDRENPEDLAREAFPSEIEVERIVLKDGREIQGTGGSLVRHFPWLSEKVMVGQRYLEPNLGLWGEGGFWTTPQNLRESSRIRRILPKLILKSYFSENIDAEGSLVIDGIWTVPGAGEERRTATLRAAHVSDGGTLFLHEDLGLQCVRVTAEYPALRDRAGLSPSAPSTGSAPAPIPESLLSAIADLRRKAPDVPWPEPFHPEPERAARAAERRDLVDGDAEKSLLRLRFALTYGPDLPALALTDPAGFLRLEDAVRACFRSGSPEEALKLAPDALTLGAVVRDAPSLEKPMESGPWGEGFIHFPRDYSPWRKWPLLVALHGQGCQTKPMYDLWKTLADEAGMILVCPRYGSAQGFKHVPKEDEKVFSTVRALCLQHNVDPDRLYLTGISMGGAMTWRLTQVFPGRWAAAAPEIHGPVEFGSDAKKFPTLANLRSLPFYLLEGEFDGRNTTNSRAAVEVLRKWEAPIEYYEAKWYGHSVISWKHPAVAQWFSRQRRDPHPFQVEHHALHRFEAERAWLIIDDVQKGLAWSRRDGSYSLQDLVGVKASLEKDQITLRAATGRPAEVELLYDPKIMPDRLTIRAGRKKETWVPRPSAKFMLERVLSTGDRAQLYYASVRFRF